MISYNTIFLIFFLIYIFALITIELTLFTIIFCRNKYTLWKKIELIEEDLEKSYLGYFNKRILYQIRNGYDDITKSISLLFPYTVYDLIDDQTVPILRFSNNYKIINKRFKKLKNK